MPSSCEFHLNKSNAVYFSSETIEGSIVLNTTSPKDVKDVRIIFKGEGKVIWKEAESSTNDAIPKRNVRFKSNKLYFYNSTNVEGEGTIPPGSYTYTFSIQLPPNCPTSLEGRYGRIRYELTLKINRELRFDNIFSKPISVIRPVDLNLMPSYRLPIECEDVTSTCFWTCSRGKILYTFKTPFGGYTSGQALKYSLNIQNQSRSDIDGYSIEFYKKMLFTARTPQLKTREVRTCLYEQKLNNSCSRLTTRLIEGQFLIPATSPSTDGPGIISVEYYLKLVAIHLGSCDIEPELTLPIFIGTVPLRDSFVPIYVQGNIPPAEDWQPTAPEIILEEDDTGNDLPPNYRHLGPPSFEEAIRSNSPFFDIDIEEPHHNTNFRPLYPMYSQTDE